MNQKTVGLTLRATILALALILVAGSLPLLPLDGVAYAQTGPTLTAVVAPDNSSVSLTWTAVGGATDYEVYRQEQGGTVGRRHCSVGSYLHRLRCDGRHELLLHRACSGLDRLVEHA